MQKGHARQGQLLKDGKCTDNHDGIHRAANESSSELCDLDSLIITTIVHLLQLLSTIPQPVL
jgi:hypothetical protein